MKHLLIVITTTLFVVFITLLGNTIQVATNKLLKTPSKVYADVIENFTIDLASTPTIGSPLVFGGVHAPDKNQTEAWDLLKDVGITSIRKDMFLEYVLPKNITIDDYKSNANNVRDTSNWNQASIDGVLSTYVNAKNRGMKVIAILSYIPNWLGYRDNHSVPRDWDVYKDLVKKSYSLYRPYIDYIEIWNEPDYDYFLNASGSNLGPISAYIKIYKTAREAIREVDEQAFDGKMTPILGPALSKSENINFLDKFLGSLKPGEIDGLTLHSYGKTEPSWLAAQKLLTKYKFDIPILVDEWNYSASHKDNQYNYTNIAIPYTGQKLIDFLRYGIQGANYYATTKFDNYSSSIWEKFGFYEIKNGSVTLLPQGRTWKLLSKTMGLGTGISKIYNDTLSNRHVIGFTNKDNLNGVIIINSEQKSKLTKITFSNVPIANRATVRIYHASEYEDGSTEECSGIINIKEGIANFSTLIPEESVTGITVEPVVFNPEAILHVLGIRTTADCLIK